MVPGVGKGGSEARVAVMHLRSSRGFYGAERVIISALEYADKSRFDVSLACFGHGRPGELVEAARGLGVPVDVVGGSRFSPLTVLRLASLMRKRGIRVLHTHDYKSDIMGLAAARLVGAKVVATPHAWSGEGGKVAFYEGVDRLLLRFFDMVLPLHDGARLELIDAGVPGRRLRVVRIGVGRSGGSMRSSAEVRREFGFGDDDAVVCYVGRLAKRKRVEDIVEAFSQVIGKAGARLLVVGDGPEMGGLQALARRLRMSDAVVFTGFREDRLDLVKAADLLVLASTEEGLPVCVMEAMSLGKPVVATRIEGLTELVDDGVSGILVPPKSPDKLAEAMVRILSDKGLGARMGGAGLRILDERFSPETMAREYGGVYSEVSGCG